MPIFDIGILKNLKFYNHTNYGDTLTIINITERINSLDMNLVMFSCDKRVVLVKLFTEIRNNNIEIIDFLSNFENCGNGSQTLKNLKKCIDIIMPVYQIKFIKGKLSYVDFEHWEKLIHMYSNIDTSYKFTINHETPLNNILQNLNKFKDKNLYFRIFL